MGKEAVVGARSVLHGLEFEKRPGLELTIHESLRLDDWAPRKGLSPRSANPIELVQTERKALESVTKDYKQRPRNEDWR